MNRFIISIVFVLSLVFGLFINYDNFAFAAIPTSISCSGTDEVILGTTARLSSIADANGNIISSAYTTTSANNIAIPALGVNYTFTSGITYGTFPVGALISYTGVYGSALNANGTPMWCIPTDVTVSSAPVIVTPPSTTYTSTGKKAEGQGKITAITINTYTVGNLLIRINNLTVIKLDNNKPLVIGNQVEYKGTKNTDGSITASSFKIQ